MKLIHIADIHARRETIDKVLQSLFVVRQAAEANGVDLICISGDTWDQTIHASSGSGFNQTIDAIKDLADVAPVVMIYGTPSHDIEGSLDVFGKLNTRCGITVLQAGKPYFLDDECRVRDYDLCARAVIFGVPEPNKKWLMPALETKTAAEAAVRDGLRGFFLGLGGLRKEHSELPCVLLYHGQVAGARLQNGDSLDRGEGMRASIDDLAAVGADYIALGDIHEPQQVGESNGLQAFYPGSVYPINFGETHRAGANLVTIHSTSQPISLERINFNHPVNQTIRIRVKTDLFGNIDLEHNLSALIPGNCIKLEITVEKEHAAGIDVAQLSALIERSGGAQGSRVELNVLPTETVRAGAIAEVQGLAGKLKLWAENSAKTIPDQVYALANDLEAEAKAQGLIASGAQIRLDRLVLRGAIGLWAKSRLDEVVFDFQDFDNGLIAILGKNGDGKTTLLENMHPWPCMLTRSGVIKDHFRLRDSMRDLYWTDIVSGYQYHALITIDAGVKSGGVEYYLYQDQGAGFQPMTGINGRKEPYETEINRIFGSMELYLRSAFVTQRQPKGLKDLGDATPGERKALFAELVGLEYFDTYKTLSATRAKDLEASVKFAQAGIEGKRSAITEKSALISGIETAKARIPVLDTRKTAVVTEGQAANHRAAETQALMNEQSILKRDIDAHKTRLQTIDTSIQSSKAQISSLESKVIRLPEAERTIIEYDELKKQEEAENAKYRTWSEEQRKLQSEHTNRLQTHADEDRRLRELLARIQREQDKETAAFGSLQKDHERVSQELTKPIDDHCPTCKQMLPADALAHVQAARGQLQNQLDHIEVTMESSKQTLAHLERKYDEALEAVTEHGDKRPGPGPAAFFDQTELDRIKDALAWLDIESARATVTACATAQVEIQSLKTRIDDLTNESALLAEKIQSLQANLLHEDLVSKFNAEQQAVNRLREEYNAVSVELATALESIRQSEIRLESISKIELEIAETEAKIQADQTTAGYWRILETACSDKGIPALELDAAGPGIAVLANGLLKDAFDSRYQIEFATTRIGAAGNQIEGFDIMILDTKTGTSQEISTLSGGEAVWIRRALYDAFGIIRARNTGLQFLTVFMDEADGALDPDARVTYLRMLESAHNQAGRAHSLIITHSPELQDMIQQRVLVRELKPRPSAIPAMEAA